MSDFSWLNDVLTPEILTLIQPHIPVVLKVIAVLIEHYRSASAEDVDIKSMIEDKLDDDTVALIADMADKFATKCMESNAGESGSSLKKAVEDIVESRADNDSEEESSSGDIFASDDEDKPSKPPKKAAPKDDDEDGTEVFAAMMGKMMPSIMKYVNGEDEDTAEEPKLAKKGTRKTPETKIISDMTIVIAEQGISRGINVGFGATEFVDNEGKVTYEYTLVSLDTPVVLAKRVESTSAMLTVDEIKVRYNLWRKNIALLG